MNPRAIRWAAALTSLVVGFFAVAAALERPDAPSRATRRLELVDLIGLQDDRVRGLQEEVRDLRAELDGLRAGGEGARDLLDQAGDLKVSAGGAGLEGPGVVVTLDDSDAGRSPSGDPNDLVVHEEDIQAVVNALWAAGAEAVALNGERLTTASAVRCAGNTLLLHGAVHSPPYEIAAIGDAGSLEGSLMAQPGMGRLGTASETFGIGLTVQEGSVRIPEKTVVPPLSDARPVA